MRNLSKREIARCENAVGPECKCRCGGALHGKGRGGLRPDGSPDYTFFENLPPDDPHHLLTAKEKRERTNAAAREKTRLKQERRAAAWARLREG